MNLCWLNLPIHSKTSVSSRKSNVNFIFVFILSLFWWAIPPFFLLRDTVCLLVIYSKKNNAKQMPSALNFTDEHTNYAYFILLGCLNVIGV